MLNRAIFRLAHANTVCKNFRNSSQCMSSYASSVPVKEPHMNDFPAPHEPYEVGYKRRQVGNTAVLIFGIVFFAASASFVWSSGVMVPNLTPPKKNLGEK